jgi:surface antigen
MKKMLPGTMFTLLMLVSLQVQGDITGLRFTPMAKMGAEDLAIYTEAMEDALNNMPDHQARFWENSNSGSHGSLTPVRSGIIEGKRCRLMEINNSVAHHSGRFHFNFCEEQKGVWVIMPLQQKKRVDGQ